MTTRGHFSFEHEDQTINLIFRTWAFKRFCDLNNLSFSAMLEILSDDIHFDKLIQLVLCAAEYACKKENKEFNYTDVDACEWIDSLGGISGKKFLEMIPVITQALTDEGSQQNGTTGKKKKLAGS
jgi:hypothetical protein